MNAPTISLNTRPDPFEVCAYNGGLRCTIKCDDKQSAEFHALGYWRDDPSCQVTIYGPSGNALRGWYMRSKR